MVDSPERLEQNYGAHGRRVLLEMERPQPDGTLVDDVVIDDWRRPWNLRSDRPLGGIPSSSLWATGPAGFRQVGCIYSSTDPETRALLTKLGIPAA